MSTPTVYLVGPKTQRLTHRAFTIADAPIAYQLNSNPDVLRYTGDTALESIEDARRFIAEYPDFSQFGFGRWACVLRETQTVIGFCGLKYLTDLDLVDVGFRFLPRYWGKGLGTEACTACLSFGLEVMGLKRIVAYVMPENMASIRVLQKSGMRFDGEFDYDGIATLRYVITKTNR